MVACSNNPSPSDNFLVNNRIVHITIASFHIPTGVAMKEGFKKIKDISFKSFNFIFLIPVYYIGVGISSLLWHLGSKRKKNLNNYWIRSEKIDKNIRNHEERY